MEIKHTKGKWEPSPLAAKIFDERNRLIIDLDPTGEDGLTDEMFYNTKLCGAAPAMLELLLFLKEDYEQNDMTNHSYYELISNVITKAT